jgi:hypothetical protein
MWTTSRQQTPVVAARILNPDKSSGPQVRSRFHAKRESNSSHDAPCRSNESVFSERRRGRISRNGIGAVRDEMEQGAFRLLAGTPDRHEHAFTPYSTRANRAVQGLMPQHTFVSLTGVIRRFRRNGPTRRQAVVAPRIASGQELAGRRGRVGVSCRAHRQPPLRLTDSGDLLHLFSVV